MSKRKNGSGSTSTPRRRRRRFTRAPAPDMATTLASTLGGGGGALLGGFLANRGWDPSMVALAMTVGGGVGAYTLDGNLRVAANGLAAAGAGQLALSLLAKSAEKDDEPKEKAAAKPANLAALPPGAIESAFERARRRLAIDDDAADRYADAIDVYGEEYAPA